MASACNIVDRTVPGSTGDVAYTDRGFPPVALLDVHANGNSFNAFSSAEVQLAFGVDDPASASDGPARSVCYSNADGDAQPEGHSGIFDTLVHGGSSTATGRAAIKSVGDRGETLHWSEVSVSGRHYPSLAVGGDGLQAAVGDFILPTAGSVTVSGLAFAPTFVMLIWELRSSLGGTASGGRIGYGFSDGTHHRSVSCRSPLGLSSDERVMFRDDAVSSQITAAGGVEWRSPISFTSDGFTLTPDVYPAATKIHGYLALAGAGTVVVGTESEKTSTGVKSTATGNVPTLVLLIGCGATVANANTDGTNLLVGMITENQNASAWCGAEDGAGTANTSSYETMSKAYAQGDYSGTTIGNAADGSLSGTGFDMNWTAADGAARLFAYAALEIPVFTALGGAGNRWWWWRGY